MIGFVPGGSVLHRAHPYTPLAWASAVLVLVFAVTTPAAVWLVAAAALLLAVAGGVLGHVLRSALVLALPTWLVLFLLHGVFGDAPCVTLAGLALSEPGLTRALVLGGRIGAIVVAFVAALATVSPARLVEAMTDRGVPFSRIFLLVSTLTFLPRTRERAARILDAQQARGLRIGGSPVARFRALVPLVLPLVLGALAEVDEQVLALDARGAMAAPRRTALEPPADSAAQRTVRWALVALVVAAYGARFAGWGL